MHCPPQQSEAFQIRSIRLRTSLIHLSSTGRLENLWEFSAVSCGKKKIQFWSPLKTSGIVWLFLKKKADDGQQPLGISAGLGKFNTRHAGQRTKIFPYYVSGINTRWFNSINSMPSCSCHTCKCYWLSSRDMLLWDKQFSCAREAHHR